MRIHNAAVLTLSAAVMVFGMAGCGPKNNNTAPPTSQTSPGASSTATPSTTSTGAQFDIGVHIDARKVGGRAVCGEKSFVLGRDGNGDYPDTRTERCRHFDRVIGAAVGYDNHVQLPRGRGGNELAEQAPDHLAFVVRGNHDGCHSE